MIVLDTNVVSELMRSAPDQTVVSWVDRQDETTLFVTTITLAEIRFGIAALPEGRRRDTLSATFEEQVRPQLADRVLAFDEAASIAYADLRAAARRTGVAISDADALIAATAASRSFDVATRDTAPFEASGLRVLNPFATS